MRNHEDRKLGKVVALMNLLRKLCFIVLEQGCIQGGVLVTKTTFHDQNVELQLLLCGWGRLVVNFMVKYVPTAN